MKIDKNQIDWIKIGERASPKNTNRPTEQLLERINEKFSKIDEILKGLEGELEIDLLLKVISSSEIEEVNLEVIGSYIVCDGDIRIFNGLPIGFHCFVIANGVDININFGSEKILENDQSSFKLISGRTAKLLKISNTKWAVSVERLLLSVEEGTK